MDAFSIFWTKNSFLDEKFKWRFLSKRTGINFNKSETPLKFWGPKCTKWNIRTKLRKQSISHVSWVRERERCWHTLIVNSLNLAWTKQSVCEYERGRKKFKKELIIRFTRMILLYYFNFCINILWLKKRCMSWLCLSFPFPTFLYYSCSPFAFAPHHSFYKLKKLQQTLQSSNAIFSWIFFTFFWDQCNDCPGQLKSTHLD